MSDFHTMLEKLQDMVPNDDVKEVFQHVNQNKSNCVDDSSQKDATLIFLDIESTGLDLEKDRIIQLASLKQRDEKVEIYNDLCYTDVDMSFDAMGVHHITPEMIEDKYWPYETDSFKMIEEENKETNYFISHSNTLDVAMLENEGLELKMKRIDTDQCARHLLKDAKNYKLQTLRYQYGLYKKEQEVSKKFGIDAIRAHDAMGDALLHYLLFELLLEKVNGNIDRLVTLTDTPVLLEKITFGKYKDKDMTFEELFRIDPMDFVWMYTHLALKWKDLENTVEHWLRKDLKYWTIAQEKRKKMAWFD